MGQKHHAPSAGSVAWSTEVDSIDKQDINQLLASNKRSTAQPEEQEEDLYDNRRILLTTIFS